MVIAAVIIAIVLLTRTSSGPDGKGDYPTNVVDETTTGGVVKDDETNETETAKTTVYENDKLSIAIPEGWTATIATPDVNAKGDGTNNQPNPAAVNITNGLWILYINVDASQASGVEGGRFAEIAMGAPSVDAVVTVQPNECGTTTRTPAFDNYTRVDYTINYSLANDVCKAPTNRQTVWFFSYLTSPGNGYFNDYVLGQNPGLVVTMAYNSKIVNDFPVAGSTELNAALKEMTDIASTLKIKNR